MITPKELDGIDADSIKVNQRQALIDFIDMRLKSEPKSFGQSIFAIGILSGEGWEDVAKSVLDEYSKCGWVVEDVKCFYSFRTRIEFSIYKR